MLPPVLSIEQSDGLCNVRGRGDGAESKYTRNKGFVFCVSLWLSLSYLTFTTDLT